MRTSSRPLSCARLSMLCPSTCVIMSGNNVRTSQRTVNPNHPLDRADRHTLPCHIDLSDQVSSSRNQPFLQAFPYGHHMPPWHIPDRLDRPNFFPRLSLHRHPDEVTFVIRVLG